jgi:hypothetical protein
MTGDAASRNDTIQFADSPTRASIGIRQSVAGRRALKCPFIILLLLLDRIAVEFGLKLRPRATAGRSREAILRRP